MQPEQENQIDDAEGHGRRAIDEDDLALTRRDLHQAKGMVGTHDRACLAANGRGPAGIILIRKEEKARRVGADVYDDTLGRVAHDARRTGAVWRTVKARGRFVVDGGRARLRLVNASGREILAGLSPGDVVIVDPPPDLVDGRLVTTGGAR